MTNTKVFRVFIGGLQTFLDIEANSEQDARDKVDARLLGFADDIQPDENVTDIQ